jgi:SecD/SecF fusion protein
MGTRRRYLFVLLFVLGLVAVSALVIINKSTKLGLDLKGGIELVYQGQPTGQVSEVSGDDIERSIEIIRERIDQLGVSEPEVARLGNSEMSPTPNERSTRSAPLPSSISTTGSRA